MGLEFSNLSVFSILLNYIVISRIVFGRFQQKRYQYWQMLSTQVLLQLMSFQKYMLHFLHWFGWEEVILITFLRHNH